MSINMKKSITLHFDRFKYTVSYEAVCAMISNELKRLSDISGLSLDGLSVKFEEAPEGENTLAYFSHSKTKSIGFCFYVNKFNGSSANQIIDTCRHEFAHYVTFERFGGIRAGTCHNGYWKAVCNKLGAVPSPYASFEVTKHFK